jgi:hypothetical protein
LARRIFSETFAHLFEAQAFGGFCDKAYGAQGTMVADLEKADVHWRIAEVQGQPIAYANRLTRPRPTQSPVRWSCSKSEYCPNGMGWGLPESLCAGRSTQLCNRARRNFI